MKITVELSYKEFRALVANSGRPDAKQALPAARTAETETKPSDTIRLLGLEWDKYNLDGQHNFEDANRLATEAGKRLPTKEEFEALWEFPRVWDDDKKGLWVAVNKADLRDPDKSLFFPASGYNSGNGLGSGGSYWSSTDNGSSYYYRLYFNSGSVSTSYNYDYDYDYTFSVRCVRQP